MMFKISAFLHGGLLIATAIACTAFVPVIAQPVDPNKEAKEAQVPKVVSKEPDAPEELKTIEADTTRAILKQFKIDNPDAREHKLGLVSEAFTEDPSNPALKLERMWVGGKGTLLEVTGLRRVGQPNSAAIAPHTLRLVNLKTQLSAKLLDVDGVQQVLDRRGGKVLLLKASDTMYLLMEPVDDLQAMSLSYIGWDNNEAKYFDRIDPRFKERYDAAYKLASSTGATPEQMKDFLVEFAKQDPDKKAPVVFLALINKMRAQNTFEGYYQAYLLIKDPADAKAAYKLVKTDNHRSKMEAIAVATLADKSRMLDMNLQVYPSSTNTSEGSCWFACKYNFSADRRVSGTLTISAKQSNTPIKLKTGTYKVTVSTELTLPRWGIQKSAWLGSFDKQSDEVSRGSVTVTLSPPNYSATVPINFGAMQIAFVQRGSAGGATIYWATGDAQVSARFKSMELIK